MLTNFQRDANHFKHYLEILDSINIALFHPYRFLRLFSWKGKVSNLFAFFVEVSMTVTVRHTTRSFVITVPDHVGIPLHDLKHAENRCNCGSVSHPLGNHKASNLSYDTTEIFSRRNALFYYI